MSARCRRYGIHIGEPEEADQRADRRSVQRKRRRVEFVRVSGARRGRDRVVCRSASHQRAGRTFSQAQGVQVFVRGPVVGCRGAASHQVSAVIRRAGSRAGERITNEMRAIPPSPSLSHLPTHTHNTHRSVPPRHLFFFFAKKEKKTNRKSGGGGNKRVVVDHLCVCVRITVLVRRGPLH